MLQLGAKNPKMLHLQDALGSNANRSVKMSRHHSALSRKSQCSDAGSTSLLDGDVANTRIGLSGSFGSGSDALSQEKHEGALVRNKLQVAMHFRLEAAMSLLALPHQQEVGLAERTSETQRRSCFSVTTFKASLVVTGSPHSSCGQYLKLLREE